MSKLIVIAGLIMASCSYTTIKQDYWIGFENICKINNECVLIHKNHLLIKGDSAFLYKEPFFVTEIDTIRSASDGGFYYYRGKITRNEYKTLTTLNFTLIDCDYCIRETIIDSITGMKIFKPEFITWQVQLGTTLVIDSMEFKPSEKFPIEMKSFYESNEFKMVETAEIEFSEPQE
ncbi:hypothetical protein [Carboxylicivirga sp. N1Y90]|uniref:hypothetical protein n=1 Tax=Carboxylicivirga fragile TaxID=3417571 RepID=UPI003D33F046|nr:hypothetical protein [Marinilabiliaceae bacterium N1Y90]